MKKSICLLIFLLVISGSAAAQRPGCGDVKFSNEILSRFPRAPESCLDVISRNGQEFGVFRAQLDRVRGNTLRVRFKHPDGSEGPATNITVRPDFRVLVDGKPTRVRDLAPNQELTAYVHVTRPEVALAPATETEVIEVVPLFIPIDEKLAAAATPETPRMPQTASLIPLAGVLGVTSIGIALGLMMVRRRRMAPR